MESQFRLERPSAARALSFAAMRDACIVKGEDPWADRAQIAYSDPFAYVTMLRDWAEGKSLPPGWVPNDTFWVVEDDEVVAECDVRFPLTPLFAMSAATSAISFTLVIAEKAWRPLRCRSRSRSWCPAAKATHS